MAQLQLSTLHSIGCNLEGYNAVANTHGGVVVWDSACTACSGWITLPFVLVPAEHAAVGRVGLGK